MRRGYLYAFLALITTAAAVVAYPTAAGSVAPPSASSAVKVQRPGSHGSGVHIGNGSFLTAWHVIKDAKTVSLKTSDGKTIGAKVLWFAEEYDIAMLSADGAGISSSPLTCRPAKADEPIVAKGNPLALEFVSAYGHISGKPRKLGPWASVYITDITTVMGMSGGGVFDAAGNVLGINVGVAAAPMKAGDGWVPSITGFGMVVPSSDVCKLLGRAA
ncbi:putative trypsin-like peptidase protein [Rhizobium phage RHph_X2_25]|nr:putative trypsin-like peptidase protein [Rhizobium phage RHph_X2_25]